MRYRTSGSTATLWALLCTVLLSVSYGPSARAFTSLPVTVDDLIERSDVIFTAVVEQKSQEFRAGNIVSFYSLRPIDVWKGQLPETKDGTVQLQELGGAMGEEVRINQYVTGMSAFVPGQELLMFANTHRATPQRGNVEKETPYKAGALKLTGRQAGYYHILTDETSGKQYLAPSGMRRGGVIPSAASIKGMIDSQMRELQESIIKRSPNAPASRDAAFEQSVAASEPIKRLERFEPLESAKDRITVRAAALARKSSEKAETEEAAEPVEEK